MNEVEKSIKTLANNQKYIINDIKTLMNKNVDYDLLSTLVQKLIIDVEILKNKLNTVMLEKSVKKEEITEITEKPQISLSEVISEQKPEKPKKKSYFGS